MTKEQIKYIVEDVLEDNLDRVTPLLSARYITLTKFENKYINVNSLRVKFDTTNEVLECYYVEKYTGEIPASWVVGKNYDTINGVNYKYLMDRDENPIIDYYDFSAVMLFALPKEA